MIKRVVNAPFLIVKFVYCAVRRLQMPDWSLNWANDVCLKWLLASCCLSPIASDVE